MEQQPPMSPDAPQPDTAGNSVCITKLGDGTYTVAPDNDAASAAPESPDMESQEASQAVPCKTFEEAAAKAREMLDGGQDDRMSVEQAFGQGFQGDSVDQQPKAGGY